MELFVEKKIACSRKIYLTYGGKIIFYVVHIKNGVLVVNAQNHENELTIKEGGWFNIKYSVVKESEIFNFKVISYFRCHYQFASDTNTYEIFGHKESKYSIIENGLQIGSFIEYSLVTQYKILYQIECNSDANIQLIFSFLLVLHYRDENN